jgi:hypothetical protein
MAAPSMQMLSAMLAQMRVAQAVECGCAEVLHYLQ